MKRSIVAMLAGAAVSGISFVPTTASSQEVTLRLHTFLPPVANPSRTFLAPWAKRIGEASNGRIKVQPFWAMQLGGKAPQLLDQVRDGVVDIVWTLPGFTAGRMPRVEVFELPFVHRDAVSTTLAMQDFQDKYLGKELGDYKVLIVHAHAGVMFMTKRPVLKMSDLRGMKLRSHSRTGVWLVEALGGAAVGAPLNRIPPMLAKGVIDGALLPFEIAPAVKMHELVSHFTQLSGDQPRLGTAVFTFLMNKGSYNRLPADLKAVIDAHAGRNIARATGENWMAIEKPGERIMRSKAKNKFYVMDPAETARIKEAAQPVFRRWFREIERLGEDGPAMLADARAMIAKYSK